MSLRDQILSAADLTREAVDVPEWGVQVNVRAMTGTERDEWEAAAFKDGKADLSDFRAKLLVRTLCDDAGARIFTDDDTAALSAKSAPTLVRLYDAASRINALSKKDVDDLTKNSSGGPGGDSPSGSPPVSG